MARLAAEIAGAVRPDSADPDPAFVEQLRLRMRAADAGLATVQVPPPVRDRVGRAGRAAAVAAHATPAAAGRDRRRGRARGRADRRLRRAAALRTRRPSAATMSSSPARASGTRWRSSRTLPPGSAARFSTAAFDGFVVNDGGEVRALSSVCTHMGCTLHYRPEWQDLRCPCHGASFDLAGRLANGRRTWRENPYPGDARAYPIQLPDLVRPRVKVEDGAILVWTAQA